MSRPRLLLSIPVAVVLFLSVPSLKAQNDTAASVIPQKNEEQQKPAPHPFVFKPTLGLGTGMLSYYGDLYQKHLVNPQVSRVGFELSLDQPINPYLRLGFYTMFGKLGANERLIYRNLNFESQIRVGGVHLEYNFANFIKPGKVIHPYISAGFESFEFLTKTDLYDANGVAYNYWSDGSIRSLPENSPFASQATFLVRDYTYETDVREQNLDGFGKYQERSFAVPVGAGFLLQLTDKFDFKLGATMHFSFTDYIDGVTAASTGPRVGTTANDNFLFTSFSLRYNLTGPAETVDSTGKDPFSDVDYYALDQWDYDQDGVIDLKDSCAGTPKGVEVDAKGCPLDEDGDLTPNYRDQQLGSSKGTFTDEVGVTLTDSIIQMRWDMYNDSTGELFAKHEVIKSGQNLSGTGGAERKVYQVSLGTYSKGVSNETLTRLLSVSDLTGSMLEDSSTIYTAGKFYDLRDAEKRRKQLEAQGFSHPVLVYKTQDGKYVEVKDIFVNSPDNSNNNNSNNNNSNNNNSNNNNSNNNNSNNNNSNNNNSNNNNSNNNNSNNNNSNPVDDNAIVFRVQLGAFSHPISKSAFADVPDLTIVKTEDGLYKYMSGSYATFDEATKAKVALNVKGYAGAFITAYKNGKRIPLDKAGAIYMKQEKENLSDTTAQSPDVKPLVEFRVQLGVFKNAVPTDVMDNLNKIQGVKHDVTAAGLTRYTAGSTNDYKAILALKDQLKLQGFPDSFIIAFFKGQQITVPEALELMK